MSVRSLQRQVKQLRQALQKSTEQQRTVVCADNNDELFDVDTEAGRLIPLGRTWEQRLPHEQVIGRVNLLEVLGYPVPDDCPGSWS